VENSASRSQPDPIPAESPKPRGANRQVTLLVVSIIALVLAAVVVRETTPMRSMLRSLRSGDETTRREAAANLSNMNTVDIGTAIPAVGVAMVSDPSAEVRSEAIRTMGTLGAESINRRDNPRRDQALGALLAAFDDKDPKVRALAISTIPVLAQAATFLSGNENDLTPMGAPKAAVAKLLPILNGPDQALRSTAATTLGSFPVQLDSYLPTLLKEAAAEPPGERPGAVGVMTGLLRKVRPLGPSVPLLMKSLDSDDPRLRFLAITTLGQAGSDAVDAVPDLIKTLKDPAGADERDDPARAAATALGDIAPETPRAAEVMAALQDAKSSANKGRERAITSALRKFEGAAP